MAKKILVVDDEFGIRTLLNRVLNQKGFEVKLAGDGNEGLQICDEWSPDLLLLDLKMPGRDGISTMKEIRKRGSSAEVIMFTAHSTVESAVGAMKLGAADYLKKPFDVDELLLKIERVLGLKNLKEEVAGLRSVVESQFGVDNIIGNHPSMSEIKELVETVADSNSTVLITGESGTGKELIAAAIHYNSPRRKQKFIKFNCAAISESLLESELFGHEKGAFTGAIATHQGRFEQADGGTILLDEVSEMSAALQAKLLRVLQEREFYRVGGKDPVKVDVRVLATTNRDLADSIKKGKFREDLLYRLNVFNISFPPLRDRLSDVPVLAEYFLKKYNEEMNKKIEGLSPTALKRLESYNYPGNVREMQNIMERAMVLCRGGMITENELPALAVDDQDSGGSSGLRAGMTIDDAERKLIHKTLETVRGNRTKAAEMLGISIRTLRNKLNQYADEKSN